MKLNLCQSRLRPIVLATLLAIGLSITAMQAEAQNIHNSDAADALFREGRAAAKLGDYPKAYGLLQQSLKLDPVPGTLLNLADVEEHLGNSLAALEHFQMVMNSLTRSDDRFPIAKSRAEALDRRLPHLLVHVKGATSQVVIIADGGPNGAGATTAVKMRLTAEIPRAVTPGTYTLYVQDGTQYVERSTEATDNALDEITIDFAAVKETAQREQVEREQAQKDAINAQIEASRQLNEAIRQRAQEQGETVRERHAEIQTNMQVSTNHGLHLAGALGFGGPGIVGVTIGSVFGVNVLNDKSTVTNNCRGKSCNQTGLNAASDGQTASTVSTVSLAIGAPLAALGIYFFVKFMTDDTTLSAGPILTGTGLTLVQRF